MKQLNFKKKIKLLHETKIKEYKLDNKSINLIDINYNQEKAFQKISNKSNDYIKNSFNLAIDLIKKGISNKLINSSKFIDLSFLISFLSAPNNIFFLTV